MKDLIMKIVLIGFVIFLGYTFIYGDSGTLEAAADSVVGHANTVLSTVDVTSIEHVDQ